MIQYKPPLLNQRVRIQSLESIAHLCANNSFKPTPHRGVGHVPTLR